MVRETMATPGISWSILRHDVPPSAEGHPPLVLLHGGGVDSADLSYGAVADQLASGRQVILPDLPGYGQTTVTDEAATFTIEWYARAVEALLEELGIDSCDLGGLSLGGGITLGTALAAPERVRRLLLFAPYGLTTHVPAKRLALYLMRHPSVNTWLSSATFSTSRATKYALRGLVKDKSKLTDDLIAAVRNAAAKNRDESAWYRFQQSEIGRSGLRTCYLDRLPEIEQPTLLLAGGADRLVPVEDCRQAAARVRACKLEILEGCGHWIGRDCPEAFVHAVEVFLAEHADSVSP